MRRNRIKLLGLVFALGALAMFVLAAAPVTLRHGTPGSWEARFAEADRDGNGAVSQAEFDALAPDHNRPRHSKMFARLDQNRDGSIQKDEMKKAHEDRAAKHCEMFTKADQNSDGKISRDEFLALEPEHARNHAPWERMDKNGDGLIQRSELPAPGEDGKAPPPPEAEMAPDMPPPPPPPDAAGREGHPHPKFNPTEWFTECDTNGDGVLDQKELQAQHAKMRAQAFERMDENKDGYLDADEWKQPHGPGGPPPREGRGTRGEQGTNGNDVGLAMASVSTPLTAPDRFLLAEAYPNPFNNSTTIRYDLPEAVDVTLAVYNVSGELVKTLVQEHQPSGHYQVALRLADQTSGLYFYRLQAGEFAAVNRITYLK